MNAMSSISSMNEGDVGEYYGPLPLVTAVPRDVGAFHVDVNDLEPVDEVISIPPGSWAHAGGRRARVTRRKRMTLSVGGVHGEMQVRRNYENTQDFRMMNLL